MGEQNKAYIKELINKESDLYDLKDSQVSKDVPAIKDDSLQIIKTVLLMSGAKKILEIGTAQGASSLFFSETIGEGCDITTIERDDSFYIKANKNIASKENDTIHILHGEAGPVLKSLDDQFDLIFMDGAKAQYINMLEDCIRLLKPNGILIADNVLFRGMVSGEEPTIRRKITIVKRLRKFLEAITHDERLVSSIIDCGDGVSISVKVK